MQEMSFINIDKWRDLNEVLFNVYIQCYSRLEIDNSLDSKATLVEELSNLNILGQVTENNYGTAYIIAREIGIFYKDSENNHILGDIARNYLDNKLSYNDYLKYYILNTEFLINGLVIHPFGEIVEFLKSEQKSFNSLVENLPNLFPGNSSNEISPKDCFKKFLNRCVESKLLCLENNLYFLSNDFNLTKVSINHTGLNPIDFKEKFIGRDNVKHENVVKEMINTNIESAIFDNTDPNRIEILNRKNITMNSESQFINFKSNCNFAFLNFSEELSLRFVSSLLTKPFVILTGLSGSGKTKLAQAFAMWICESKDQYCIVPVGADWTNREPLLGFPNALKQEEYCKPGNNVLDLIIDAIDNSKLPFFLILDEMNLSHVERYFADFLSVMETNKEISLHTSDDNTNNVPKEITLPSNLFIIGTVNIDETTYMFSPKVLDRANVIEFRITEDEIKTFFENPQKIDLNKLLDHGSNTGIGASQAEEFLKLAKHDFDGDKDTNLKLVEFFDELKKAGAEFGYRSASDISRLISILKYLTLNYKTPEGEELEDKNFIDIAIMQKLLPKLHGSRSKLNPILLTLAKFCVEDGIEKIKDKDKEKVFIDSYLKEVDDKKNPLNIKILYPISYEKIVRMYNNALTNGYTSYAEA